jgi:exopolyphosphatase/guanosine-5'-triphosphate,3'-diphosphate pyrophosphatase
MLPEYLHAPIRTIALAGTPVTLAGIHKGLQEYSENELEGYILSKENIVELYRYLVKYNPAELLNKHPDLLKNREDLILSGTAILLYLIRILEIPEVIVSTKGIRYGAVIKYLRQIS